MKLLPNPSIELRAPALSAIIGSDGAHLPPNR
jgi:hypothetical protein